MMMLWRGNPKKGDHFERNRWVDNITMDLTETGSMWKGFIWLKVVGSDGHL
jgi:hypothetical protein